MYVMYNLFSLEYIRIYILGAVKIPASPPEFLYYYFL